MSNNVTEKKWWQSAVVYQIYPKSFQDSNGDGVGDLRGIMERLEYLGKLGIDAIWLSPVCKSPQADNGYDISDYQDIDPMFGSVEDMEALIKEAKKYNIRIIMDLVLNHTSNKHRWFEEAKKSKDNPYHDYYVWRDGEEGVEPNDMKAVFGGSAWEWVPEIKQYYFHQFLPEQPDLNWENPQVRKEIYDMILWWMEKGVGGFRLDVIDQIAKEPDKKITINGPRLHEYFREMSKETFQKGDLITVGEAWGADPERAKLYSNPDGSEFSMVFQFEHIGLDQQEGKDKWDLAPLPFLKLKQIMNRWQTELYNCGWNSLFWDNHDLPRIVSRWGNDKEYRVESAKMLAILLHGMQGTPYIFEGEELGMTNVYFDKLEDYRDIESINYFEEFTESGLMTPEHMMKCLMLRSRDNARTPMQWDDSKQAGFTEGEPWIKVNPNYKKINAAQQLEDPDSVFHYYQKLIRLRKEKDIIVYGEFEPLYREDEQIFAYTRKGDQEKLLTVCNFSDKNAEVEVPEEFKGAECLITNLGRKEFDGKIILNPYEAFVLYYKHQVTEK